MQTTSQPSGVMVPLGGSILFQKCMKLIFCGWIPARPAQSRMATPLGISRALEWTLDCYRSRQQGAGMEQVVLPTRITGFEAVGR